MRAGPPDAGLLGGAVVPVGGPLGALFAAVFEPVVAGNVSASGGTASTGEGPAGGASTGAAFAGAAFLAAAPFFGALISTVSVAPPLAPSVAAAAVFFAAAAVFFTARPAGPSPAACSAEAATSSTIPVAVAAAFAAALDRGPWFDEVVFAVLDRPGGRTHAAFTAAFGPAADPTAAAR